MARILLGVTGGIAAYKACTLVRLLVRAGHEVEPVLTAGAVRFVAPETFRALARRPAGDDPYPHLGHWDLLVVAPLTANTLARMAHGLADDVLTEAVLAHAGPVLVAPAMNTRMWLHPATQGNVATLRARGVELVGPAEGELAEGEEGIGRMAEPEEIFARVEALLDASDGPLRGKTVLVSAGGTREPLDSVRYVGNRSSGRMGVALAEEARSRGAKVTLLAANLAIPRACGHRGRRDADGRRPRARGTAHAPGRTSSSWPPRSPTIDHPLRVCPSARRTKSRGRSNSSRHQTSWPPSAPCVEPEQVIVGFAADEGDAGLERARHKREAKGADLFVFNDIARADIGFDSEENEVVIVSANGDRAVAKAPKRAVAAAVLDEVERLLSSA